MLVGSASHQDLWWIGSSTSQAFQFQVKLHLRARRDSAVADNALDGPRTGTG